VEPKDRVIGYVSWAPPISYVTAPHGGTVDFCVIKLDDEKFLKNFKGNVLDLGICQSILLKVPRLTVNIPGHETSKTRFTELMFSSGNPTYYFDYPNDWLLEFRGILPAKDILKANKLADNDEPLPLVLNEALLQRPQLAAYLD
jgi:hypothetical protein